MYGIQVITVPNVDRYGIVVVPSHLYKIMETLKLYIKCENVRYADSTFLRLLAESKSRIYSYFKQEQRCDISSQSIDQEFYVELKKVYLMGFEIQLGVIRTQKHEIRINRAIYL
jgi:hypothetical protein